MVHLASMLLENKEELRRRKHEEPVKFLSAINFFSRQLPPQKPRLKITTAVLLLTNRCQLKCIYCYAARGQTSPKSLKFNSAKAVIDEVFRLTQMRNEDEYVLDLHGGGEPTLEWDLMENCIEYARSKQISVKIHLTSNLIWSAKQVNYVIKKIDHLSVSMDGIPDVQNRNRPFFHGGKSSQIVMDNLKRLDDKNYSYGIRLTATPPWNDLYTNIDFILKNTNCRSIQVEPAFEKTRAEEKSRIGDDWEEFSKEFIYAIEKTQTVQDMVNFSGIDPTCIRPTFCNALSEAIIVNPEDDLVGCYEVSHSSHPLAKISTIGKVVDGKVLFNHKNRRKLTLLQAERLNHCQDCFCRWTCAGGCYARTFSPGEDGHLHFENYCRMVQKLTRDFLLHLIARNNGVWNGTMTKKSQPND